MMQASEVLVVGGGGHGSVIVDILHRDPSVQLLGLADADPARLGAEVVGGYRVIAVQSEILARFDPARVGLFLAIGDNAVRERLASEFAAAGFRFVNAIDPTAHVALGVRLGTGVAIMAQAVVGARAVVGDQAIVNTKATVDHDCVVGRVAHLAPGATLGGDVRVGDRALLGIGCSILRGVAVGADAVVPVGFAVYRDVPEGRRLSPRAGKLSWTGE